MGKIHLFTFCVDIETHNKQYLLQVLNSLINSLDKHNNNYEFHIFTNYDLQIINPKIIIEEYFDKNENYFGNRGYQSKWLNLSWNKINIYKYLFDKYNINFLWIDLDTVVTANIEYINEVDNYLIPIGGTNSELHSPFTNDPTNKYGVPTHKYIQGNIWKLDIKLYNNLITTFSEIQKNGLQLMWDIQTLITYYIEFKLNGKITENNIYVSGLNYKPETMNGLCMHDKPENHQHGGMESLINMYYDNDKLRSKYHPNKEIHFVGFTMYSFKTIN